MHEDMKKKNIESTITGFDGVGGLETSGKHRLGVRSLYIRI